MNTGYYSVIFDAVPWRASARSSARGIAELADVSESTARRYLAVMVERGDVAVRHVPGYAAARYYRRFPERSALTGAPFPV